MNSARSTLGHLERTALEPRENALHQVSLTQIQQANAKIRLLQLSIPEKSSIKFLPGQWLDAHIPGLPQAGGFTVTSTPRDTESRGSERGFLELAVQESPKNPPAAWLWRPKEDILGAALLVRVGGSFVWPPPGVDVARLRRVVLVAGGVGINPLISILSHLYNQPKVFPLCIKVAYATRHTTGYLEDILFYTRIRRLLMASPSPEQSLDLYVTNKLSGLQIGGLHQAEIEGVKVHQRRISCQDLEILLGPVQERECVVAYVCGPAGMTDEFVNVLKRSDGMRESNVLCEKWW